jgi:hypothetical protein
LLVVGARAKGRDLHVDSDCDQFPILESISEDRRDGLAANPGSFMSVQLQQPIARFDPFPGGAPVIRSNLHLSDANNCSAAMRELGNSGSED